MCVDDAAPRVWLRCGRRRLRRRLLLLRPVRVPAVEERVQLIFRRLRVEVAGGQALAVRGGVEPIGLRVPPSRPLTQPLDFEDVFRRGGDFIQRGTERPDLTRGPPLLKRRAEVLGPYRVNRLHRSRTYRGLPLPPLALLPLRRQPPAFGLLALPLLSQTPLLGLSFQPGPLLLLRACLQRPKD